MDFKTLFPSVDFKKLIFSSADFKELLFPTLGKCAPTIGTRFGNHTEAFVGVQPPW